MKNCLPALFTSLLLLAACDGNHHVKTPAQVAREQAAKAQAIRQTQAKNKSELVGEFGYRFEGKNASGASCSTGTRNFASLPLLCINIQDPILNSDCALSERLARFQRDCEPAFRFNESLSCRFAIYQGPVEISPDGDFDPKHALQFGEYCAGRGRGGVDMPGLSINQGHLASNLFLDLSIAFVPVQQSSGEKHSRFKLSFYQMDQAGAKTKVADDFEFTPGPAGARMERGALAATGFSYAVRCESVWGCGR